MNSDPSDPERVKKIKRPATPFAMFLKDRSIEMKRSNPNANMNDILKELGCTWHNMTEEDKDKYYFDYEIKFIEYSKDKVDRIRGGD